MKTRTAWGIVGLVLILACGAPTGGCGCTPFEYSTYFVGFVTKNTMPATGTRVTASVFETDCRSRAASVVYLAPFGAVVDSGGHYRFNLRTAVRDTLCARIVARSATDSVVRDSVSVLMGTVDTVRTDLTFP